MRLFEISDGLSYTLMIGEKHVPITGFGLAPHDSSVYNGDHPESYTRGAGLGMGLTTDRHSSQWLFGSYHMQQVQFAMCDASVQRISSLINCVTLSRLAARADGDTVSPWD